jgi:hypothetical protein
LKETSSIVEDPKSALCVEIADQAFFEARNGNGAVVPASELESRILPVQVFVKSDALATVAIVARYLGGKIGVTEEGYELAVEQSALADAFQRASDLYAYFSILVSVSHLTPSPHSQYVCLSVKKIVLCAKALSCNTHPRLLSGPSRTCALKSSMNRHTYKGWPPFSKIKYLFSFRGLRKPSC